MQTPGLSHTPFTRLLLLLIPLLSILTTSLAWKPYIAIHPSPHLYPYSQYWRILTYQISYLSSSEVLFSCVLVYNLRVLERMFGTRKYVSAVLILAVWQAVVATGVVCLLYGLTGGFWEYLPGGMSGVVMGLVSMYFDAVPSVYRWRVSLGQSQTQGNGGNNINIKGVMLTDKSTTYLVAGQLALSQFPYTLPPALVGWMLGSLWRAEVLPGSGWRVPGWMVGESAKGGRKRREFEGLRRRLEDEGRAERERDMGSATSVDQAAAANAANGRRRGVLGRVGELIRGAV